MFKDRTQSFEALRRSHRWVVPDEFNIAAACCDRHQDRANQVAIYDENEQGDERRFTFAELKAHSERLAGAFRRLGIDRGDRVAIILPQCAETAVAHLAIYRIGAVALPLSILFGRDALSYRLGDSGARAAVVAPERLELIAELRLGLPQLEALLCVEPDESAHGFWQLAESGDPVAGTAATGADDPALLIYTSGTTGPPKGALVGHRSLIGNLPGFELSHEFFPQPGDRFWTPADWAWTGGLMDALLPSLYYGVPILGYSGKFDPEKACALMQKYAIRNAFLPPTAIKMLMQVQDLGKRFRLRLRSIMSAGEQVTPELLNWSEANLGAAINEMWGQTEVNYLVGNCSGIMNVRPGSMGKPYPGHDVDVIDEAGNRMPDGELGELAARSGDPVMFLGYWNNERATREKFVGDWFCTGDLGYRDGDGYLWFVGRKDDVISSAGYRIGPGEIEDCLLKHPAVAQAAAIGIPDALRGNIVKAFIVLGAGFEPSEELATEIQDSVRSRLAAYEYPRAVEFMDSLPMTTTGKVRRIELRQMELAKAQQAKGPRVGQ